MRARQARHDAGAEKPHLVDDPRAADRREVRRRWAALIKRVYEVDPLRCPKCGGTMRIVSFIEARQRELIRNILQHCGLWQASAPQPSSRAPPEADDEQSSQGLRELHYVPDLEYLQTELLQHAAEQIVCLED